ncbi:MAG: substrate-binding domain-containing protein [Planctomycetaceae bacterium]|nr:substrate-binding domain-containing protein [Planctomycetaceae bacterium]
MKKTRRPKAVSASPRRVLFMHTDHFHPLALGALEYAASAGWVLTFSHRRNLQPSAEIHLAQAEAVIAGQVLWADEADWSDVRVPVVCATYPPHPVVRAGYVLLDFCASGRLAAEHFLAAGFRNLTYCWMGESWALNEQRKGFIQAARAGGAALHELDWAARGSEYTWDFESFRRWLGVRVGQMPKPLGLMVDSDWTGIEAVTALRAAGILVPDQVAIISCYNMEPICKGCIIPLSSVDMDWHAQGYQAAAMLDRLLNGGRLPRRPLIVPPKGVIVRQSSDVMAVPHAGVARAMHMIQNDFGDRNLSVGSIARSVGISMVGLNLAFKKHLGRSPSNLLSQRRLREAKKLLAATDLMAKDIAAACGYGTIEQFIRNIKTATGLPPRAWRRKTNAQTSEDALDSCKEH